MELQVRHLRVIRAIAQEGSLSRAAVSLGMAQPSLSHQLRRIEQLVGGPLFDRDPHGARPTELGTMMLFRAKAIVLAFDEIERDFRRQQPHLDDRVRIGWNDSAITAHLLDCVQAVLPGISIYTRSDASRIRLLAQLANRCVDLVLVMICGGRRLELPPGVRTTTLVDEPSYVALPATHRLADQEEISLIDLADENWIVSSCGDGCRVVFREMCMAHGFTPRIAHDVDIAVARDRLVIGGYGVGLVQPRRPEVPGLVVRPLAGDPMMVRHSLAWREDSPIARHADELGAAATAAYLDNATTWQSGTSGADGTNPTMVVVPAQAKKETAMSKATASASFTTAEGG